MHCVAKKGNGFGMIIMSGVINTTLNARVPYEIQAKNIVTNMAGSFVTSHGIAGVVEFSQGKIKITPRENISSGNWFALSSILVG